MTLQDFLLKAMLTSHEQQKPKKKDYSCALECNGNTSTDMSTFKNLIDVYIQQLFPPKLNLQKHFW